VRWLPCVVGGVLWSAGFACVHVGSLFVCVQVAVYLCVVSRDVTCSVQRLSVGLAQTR